MAVGAIVVFIFRLADPKPKPMMTESCWLVPWLSYGGMLAFLAGLVLFGFPALGHPDLVHRGA